MEPHETEDGLSEKKYTKLEYTVDEYVVVGNILIDGDEVVGVEVTDTYLFSIEEINDLRRFLDIAEEKIKNAA